MLSVQLRISILHNIFFCVIGILVHFCNNTKSHIILSKMKETKESRLRKDGGFRNGITKTENIFEKFPIQRIRSFNFSWKKFCSVCALPNAPRTPSSPLRGLHQTLLEFLNPVMMRTTKSIGALLPRFGLRRLRLLKSKLSFETTKE